MQTCTYRECRETWDYCAYDDVENEHVHACVQHIGMVLTIGGRWILQHILCNKEVK